MARRNDPQVNIRLAPERFEVLEAAVFVRQKGSPSALLTEVAESVIDGFAEDQAVQTALRARREQEAADRGKLQPIAAGKRRRMQKRANP